MSSPVPAKPPATPNIAGIVAKTGWIIAATLLLLTAFFAARVATQNTQIVCLSQEVELARLEAQSLKQQLEAERILNARQLANLASKEKNQSPGSATP